MEKRDLKLKKSLYILQTESTSNVCLKNEFKENPRGFCVIVFGGIFCFTFEYFLSDFLVSDK